MLRLKVTQRRTAFERAANPSRLISTGPALRLGIYAAHTQRAYFAIGAAIAFVATLSFGNTSAAQQLNTLSPPLIAFSALCLTAATALVAFSRKIVSLTIHFVPIGTPLPTIGSGTTQDPKPEQQLRTSFRNHGRYRLDPFALDIAVRLTEPNAAKRLHAYHAMAAKGLTIRSDQGELAHAQFLEAQFTDPCRAGLLAKELAHARDLKSDIWPVARLAIARILYTEKDTSGRRRTLNELGRRPTSKGAHYYLAFKTNLLVLAWWFIALASIVNLPTLFPSDVDARVAGIAGATLALLWAGCSIAYARRIVANWRRWLTSTSRRPLGLMPMFLYRTDGDGKPNWEELDEYDFNAYVEQYLMDVRTTLTIIQAASLGGLLVAAQWFNG